MALAYHDHSTATVDSPPMFRQGEFEPSVAKTKPDRTKGKPHGMRDSVRIDPEHVWGDEGPLNE